MTDQKALVEFLENALKEKRDKEVLLSNNLLLAFNLDPHEITKRRELIKVCLLELLGPKVFYAIYPEEGLQ